MNTSNVLCGIFARKMMSKWGWVHFLKKVAITEKNKTNGQVRYRFYLGVKDKQKKEAGLMVYCHRNEKTAIVNAKKSELNSMIKPPLNKSHEGTIDKFRSGSYGTTSVELTPTKENSGITGDAIPPVKYFMHFMGIRDCNIMLMGSQKEIGNVFPALFNALKMK